MNWSKTCVLETTVLRTKGRLGCFNSISTHSLSACGIPLFLEYPILLANIVMSNTVSGLQSILDALDEYMKATGINLKENPFADKVFNCSSPDSVLQLLQENTTAFKEYRDKNRKFIDCLSPVVKFVHAFSEILGEAAGLVSKRTTLPFGFFLLFLFPQGPFPTCETNLRRNRCSHYCVYPPFSPTKLF